VERAAAAPLAERRRAREDEVLAQLREHVGREDGRAAVGLDAVMDALVQRRVATLVYDPDRLQQSKNTVEDAVQSAVRQSAEVLAMRERPELGPLGEIAAILRF
jgi:stalled ribosome rescue protein Dom34